MPIQLLAMQGGGGSAVPYDRQTAPRHTTAVAHTPQDVLRLQRYEEQWRFYSGLQWSMTREDGEPLVTANYARRIVDKKASWLMGKGMVIEVPEALEEITKPVLDEVWDYNDKDELLLEIGITGGVTGDVFLLPTSVPPSSQQKAINPYTRGTIRIRLVASHQVFPTWNPLNKDELTHVRIITEVADQRPPLPGRNRAQASPMSSTRKYIEDIYPSYIEQGWEDGVREHITNDLGEIPLVHISNQPFPNEYFGLSDLDGIIDIQREFNEKLTDVSDIINYHASPVTVITGARAKQLEKGSKSLWSGLPTEAKVFNLEMTGDLPASNNYLDKIREVMFELANLPEGAFGRQQAISNTSGAALAVTFQPLLEATERKVPSYVKGLERVNYIILRYHQLMTGEALPVDLCKNCGGRIVEIRRNGAGGQTSTERKCFLINPQTLDFMKPDEVKINWKRRLTYGIDTKMLPYKDVKDAYLRKGESYWDPQSSEDQIAKAAKEADREQKLQEWHRTEEARVAGEQSDNDETARARPTNENEGESFGQELDDKQQQQVSKPAEPARLPPKELLPDPQDQVEPEQLSPHDMDIPEEPMTLPVSVMTWNPKTRTFDTENLGSIQIVPTGCDRPRYLNPYDNRVTLKSALPRDMERASNLYVQWQTNGWVSRRWVQEHLDEEINIRQVNKELADDIPFLLALQGKPDPTAQVAQTAGVQDGDTTSPINGAPAPAVAGPGRGNRHVAGDNMATPPPNGAAGDRQ